ncbi:MAG: hypothetical protein ABI837_21035 [Acidobacteriota bacterium]
MSLLVPHLLFRTETSNSPLAVALLHAGYVISRAVNDESGTRAASFEHIDAVIVDLPAVQAINFVRGLRWSGHANPAMLIATASPDVLRRACPEVDVLDIRHPDADVVSATDLMLARRHRVSATQAS